jgi:hypothetical protein
MNGFNAFAIGFGATAGVILGVYAGIKGIEGIGYLTCKKDMYNTKQIETRIKDAASKLVAEQAVA